MDPWLTQIKEYKPSTNIRLIVACRTQPGSAWENLNNVLKQIPLDVFSFEEANEFLNLAGIEDSQRREEILECSGRLPILMDLLSSPSSDNPDPVAPTAEIVDRFLRWVNDQNLRKTALEASVPHFFNIDILTTIFDKDQPSDIELHFDWLRKQPFIRQHNLGWQYHSVVRKLMLRYQSRRSLIRYQMIHHQMADYYSKKFDGLQANSIEELKSEQAQDIKVQHIYHRLMEAPNKNWNDFIDEFVLALKYNLEYAKKIVTVMNQPTSLDDLDETQVHTINLMAKQLTIINKGLRWKGIRLYEHLSDAAYTDNPEVNAYLFFVRAEALRINRNDLETARVYLDKALELDPTNYIMISELGELLIDQDKYAEAVSQFNRALKINPKHHYAQQRKGAALYALHKYKQALDILNDAYQTDPGDDKTLGYRGASYLQQKKYNKALIDLNKALEINPKHYWAKMRRGEVYLERKEYELALQDFEQLGELTNNYEHERLKNIGLVMLDKKEFRNAVDKFVEALKDEPACDHCWRSLITAYESYQPKDNVLAMMSADKYPDIEFTGRVYLIRSIALAQKGYEEGYAELHKALELEPELKNEVEIEINNHGLMLARQGKYKEALQCYKDDNSTPAYVIKYNIAIATILWKGEEHSTVEIRDAEKALFDLEKIQDSPGIVTYGLAGLEAAKNNKQDALNLLREAIRKDKGVHSLAESDPAWKLLHSDPDFIKFLELNQWCHHT